MRTASQIIYQIKRNQAAQAKCQDDSVKLGDLTEKEARLVDALSEVVGMNWVAASGVEELKNKLTEAGVKDADLDLAWVLGDGTWA